MSAFTDKDFGRLDFQLLQNSSIILYWRNEILDSDLQWLQTEGYKIDSFDCSKWNDEKSILGAFGQQLEFPDYFGKNLNALNDCISDLSFPDTGGRVLVFKKFDEPWTKMPNFLGCVLNILSTQSRYFLLFGKRFIVLIQSDDARLSIEPMGAQQVTWNPKEWLNKNRGS